MTRASRIAKVVVISCLLWLIAFPLLGGGAWGKDMFASWASKSFLHDKKAGVPVLMLTFPILISGSVASLFITSGNTDRNRYQMKRRRLYDINFCSIQKQLPEQQTVMLWLVLFLPCLVYVLASAFRKLTLDMSIDMALMKSGNIFGMLAVVVLSWVLVPVSHRGPIGRLFKWDSIKMISFHIWSGRIIIVASILHGLEHTIRYALQGKDVLKAFYFPSIGCWRNPQTFVPEICDKAESDEDCSCYDHFLPITGIVAVIGLVLIGLSSLYKIRRDHFATFAMLHYILSPLTFLAICIHYNKAIVYASGSLLYYLASNFPTWIENNFRQQPCGQQSNVKVVAVEKLNSDDSKNNPQRPCVALTMEASEAATQQFYPGAYVHLSVPSISRVSHPFSANRVVGQAKQFRVIFRVTGPFTRALENALFFRSMMTVPIIADHAEDDSEEFQNHHLSTDYSSVAFPRLYLDGYYGSGRLRSQILSRDVCVLVAAGIGITPYLSLLSEFISTSYNSVTSDGLMIQELQSGASHRPKRIILHWICRDRSLIEYCRKEYMEFSSNDLQRIKGEGERYSVKVIIHKTGGEDPELDGSRTTTANLPRNDIIDTSQYGGVPFALSKFSVGKTMFNCLRYFVTFSALSWGGLYCLWWWFNKQGESEYIHRIYTLTAVTLYGLIVAVFANFVGYLYSRKTRKNNSSILAFSGEDNDLSENFNDVELSTYKDQTHLSQAGSIPVVPVEDPFRLSAATLEMSEGRPLVENILDDLDVEKNSALFCCVPKHLSKTLREGLDQKSIFDGRCKTIPMYQESFET
jgi:predicted ferric reductase